MRSFSKLKWLGLFLVIGVSLSSCRASVAVGDGRRGEVTRASEVSPV